MAVRTRTPSKGWTSVSPYSNYAGVVSNYGAALASAQAEEKNVELQNKILDYKNGTLSYMEIKNYLNTRLATEIPGTAKELAIRETLTNVEDYERDNNVKITRARMMEQFAQGGITATEQRQIEESILSLYKPGSAEYASQLATISMAKETERVEKNNEQITRLSSQLASGDLSTKEQIDVYKQMEQIAEPGSEDRLKITAKITQLQQQKKQEDKEAEMNQKLSELMDKFAPGGYSYEEKLVVNREMQKYVKKGSEDYVNLKEQEADILGNIASTAKAESAKAASDQVTKLKDELEAYYQQSEDLTKAYEEGRINTADYLAQQSAAIKSLVGRADVLGGKADATRVYQINEKSKLLDTQKAGVESGNMVQVKGQGLVDISKLNSSDIEMYTSQEDINRAAKMGSVIEAVDSKGNSVILQKGSDGNLYEIVGDPLTGIYKKSGNTFSARDQLLKTPEERAKEEAEKKAREQSMTQKSASPLTGGASLPKVTNLPGSGIADKVIDVIDKVSKATTTYKPFEVAKKAVPTIDSPASSALGSQIKVGSGLSKKISEALKLPTPKVSGTIDLGITERLNDIMKGIPSLSSYTPTTGKVNIPTPVGSFNLPDFGITEKIGSLWNQAKSTVKNWWDKLF